MNIINYPMIFNFITVFILQLIISIVIIKLSYMGDLVDKPNKRKLHLRNTAFTGGIIIALIYAIIVFITDFNNYFMNLIMSSCFLAALCGYVDDRYNVNPGTKILLQILSIFLL